MTNRSNEKVTYNTSIENLANSREGLEYVLLKYSETKIGFKLFKGQNLKMSPII